jgi:hypothetical protein
MQAQQNSHLLGGPAEHPSEPEPGSPEQDGEPTARPPLRAAVEELPRQAL